MALFNESYRYADFLDDFALDIAAFNAAESASLAPNLDLAFFAFDSSFPTLNFEAPIGSYVMDAAALTETYTGYDAELAVETAVDDFSVSDFGSDDFAVKQSTLIEAMDNFNFVDAVYTTSDDISLSDDVVTDFDNTKLLEAIYHSELPAIVFMADDGLAEIVTADDHGYWDHAG